MAEFRPTAAQRAAIETRGGAVLVSAGAGSGKTKVLTERLMGYLREADSEADLDSFLIITYTKAAAAELRGRIMQELSRALAEDPGNRRLRRQSALCRRAQISTIHSFCAALLRENSHLAGLSPDFKILDEDRAEAMKAAALERCLEKHYRQSESFPGFLLLADTVGAGRDDRRLAQLVLDLHRKMQCQARPEQWARQQVALLQTEHRDAGETPWGRELLARAAETVDYCVAETARLIELMDGDAKMLRAWQPSFLDTLAALRELRRCLSLGWEAARACLPVSFALRGRLVKPEDPALAEEIRARRKTCMDAMDKLAKRLDAPSDKLLADLRQTAPAMTALLELTLDFDREYVRDKRRAGLADYSDLEHIAAGLLTETDGSPSELARQISRRYTEIMVDEYQDVSRVQETIFQAVSREGRNLFLVGDVKQSIYRFRLADPAIFLDKYTRYRDHALAPEGEPRRILLRENFRSRRAILNAANSVFSLCMSRALGDVDYDGSAALVYGADYAGDAPVPELCLLAADGAGDDAGPGTDKAALEARLVADRIRALVDSGLTVGSGAARRPLEYGDVAILLRSPAGVGAVFRRELAARGVPVAAGQGGSFFTSVEVSTLLSMLAILDDPHQDIPLIAVLRSPAFGFSADELSQIRACDRDADLYGALQRRAEADDRCRRFLEQLKRLRQTAPDLSAAELVWLLLEELDLLALCSAMSDGEQRRARLMELIALAESFEGSGYRGLHRFVLWLRRLAEKGREPSLGGEAAQAVQILSMHKSKGLEFPVVFLCDLARQFNRQDSQETVLVHQELGLGPKLTDLERRVEYPTLARRAIEARLDREQLSEELRLLYVAMTRSRERLYLTAAVKDPEKLLDKLSAAASAPLAPELLARAASPLSWLLQAGMADGWRHMRLSLPSRADCEAEREAAEEAVAADPETLRELQRRLSFRYPFREAEALPSKVTATELKGRAESDPDAESLRPAISRRFRLPDFGREEKAVSAAEKGVATHLVLQYMDFACSDSEQAVRREIDRLLRLRFLTEREARAVDAGAIVRLFASPLGRRMREAETLRREFRFSLLCDAGEIFGRAAGEELLLQGVVDCFLVEDGAITVIDYKTDRLRSRAEAVERAKAYASQLGAYARALRRICGLPVSACVLYFLAVGEAVTLDPADLA